VTQRQHRLPEVALSACALGFVLCPLPFLVIAARTELQPMASVILATAFGLSAGFLLARLLRKPAGESRRRVLTTVTELASWATVAAILLLISQIHLMRGLERWGAVSLNFLSASLLCFPLVWFRRTAIEHRLTPLPRAVVVSALCTVLLLSGTTLFLYLTTPVRFL
jgi:hypothetical protein